MKLANNKRLQLKRALCGLDPTRINSSPKKGFVFNGKVYQAHPLSYSLMVWDRGLRMPVQPLTTGKQRRENYGDPIS